LTQVSILSAITSLEIKEYFIPSVPIPCHLRSWVFQISEN
jgi:hypothetical protein